MSPGLASAVSVQYLDTGDLSDGPKSKEAGIRADAGKE